MNLTIEEIEELRVRVAYKLGWRKLVYNRDGSLIGNPPGRKDLKVVPAYLTNVKDAWAIIDMLTSIRIHVQISNMTRGCDGTYKVTFSRDGVMLSEASDLRFSSAVAEAFLAMPENQRVKTSGDYKVNAYHAPGNHR